MMEIKLPELGENIDTVEVSAVLVEPGQEVRKDQPLIEVETEKASLEVPSSVDGTVFELLVKPGDQVQIGQVLVRLDAAVGGGEPEEAAAPATEPAEPEEPAPAAAKPDNPRDARKKRAGRVKRSKRGKTGDGVEPADEKDEKAESTGTEPTVLSFPERGDRDRTPLGSTVPAAPSARALARQLGVDIHEVPGTGPGGRISREDVKVHTKRLIQGAATAPGGAAAAERALPAFSMWGPVEREPLSRVRRATAVNMAAAWTTIPHVTQFDSADITELESLRRGFNRRPEAGEHKLSLTAIVVKWVARALAEFPKLNASLDVAGGAVVYKKYLHVGVAVDTDRGLLVPVIRDVDRKSLLQVSRELGDLAARARDKKLGPDQMQGASFTVSNLGGLGTTYFSPIVNWPEVAILGIGRASQQPVLIDGQFQPRRILPLSLSYDHRLIDGADAARFQRWLAEALEQPLLLLLEGESASSGPAER